MHKRYSNSMGIDNSLIGSMDNRIIFGSSSRLKLESISFEGRGVVKKKINSLYHLLQRYEDDDINL